MAKTKRRNVKKGTSTKKKSDCGCKYKYNYGGTKKDLKPELRADIPDIIPLEKYPQHRFESGLIIPEDQALMNNVPDNELLNKIVEQNLESMDREVNSDEEEAIEGLFDLYNSDKEKATQSEIEEEARRWIEIRKRMDSVRSFKPPKRRNKLAKRTNQLFKPSENTLKTFQMPPEDDSVSKRAGGYLIDESPRWDDGGFPTPEEMVLTTTAYGDDSDIVYGDDDNKSLKNFLIAGSGVIIVAGGLFVAGVSGSVLLLGLGEMITNR